MYGAAGLFFNKTKILILLVLLLGSALECYVTDAIVNLNKYDSQTPVLIYNDHIIY